MITINNWQQNKEKWLDHDLALMASEEGRLQMKMKMPDGKIAVERGKYTELLKRGADGKWLSTLGVWNTDTLALK